MKRIYTPIVECRASGCMALTTLREASKKSISPLVQVWTPAYDFEKELYKKSRAKHAADESLRLRNSLSGFDAFYLQISDAGLSMEEATGMLDGIRSSLPAMIPVLAPGMPAHLHEAAVSAGKAQGRLAARVRISNADLEWASRLMDHGNVDLIADAEYVRMRDLKALIPAVQSFSIDCANRGFASVTLAGGSMPRSFSRIAEFQMGTVPRREWGLWRTVSHRMAYGDYTTENPKPSAGDMRGVIPCPKIPYTVPGGWSIFKGKPQRPVDYNQYGPLCQSVAAFEHFDGGGFSWADSNIQLHAIGQLVDFRDLALWKAMRMNHHMERVLKELSPGIAA